MDKESCESFESFIEEEQFEKLEGWEGEMYECPGMHIWHVSEIRKLWEEEKAVYKLEPKEGLNAKEKENGGWTVR